MVVALFLYLGLLLDDGIASLLLAARVFNLAPAFENRNARIHISAMRV
jgi:hypothetical protein